MFFFKQNTCSSCSSTTWTELQNMSFQSSMDILAQKLVHFINQHIQFLEFVSFSFIHPSKKKSIESGNCASISHVFVHGMLAYVWNGKRIYGHALHFIFRRMIITIHSVFVVHDKPVRVSAKGIGIFWSRHL